MLLNYRFEMNPTKSQIQTLQRWLDICRQQYNSALLDKQNLYKKSKINYKKTDMQTQLKLDKKVHPFLNELPSQPLQETCTRVEKSFNNFFSKRSGFPKIKSQKHYNSLTFPQFGVEIKQKIHKKTGLLKDYPVRFAASFDDKNRIFISKLGSVKFKQHRPIDGAIKQLVIKRQNKKWFAIFSVERPANLIVAPTKVIGFDLGIKHFATDSEGATIANPKYLHTKEKQLTRAQRKLSRSKKNSKNHQKQLNTLKKLHTKVANQRKDFLHKQSCWIARTYKTVFLEDLKIQAMLQHHKRLAKFIQDAGWGMFRQMLAYKLEKSGGQLVRINPAYTSQDCSGCGVRVPKDLSVRTHNCAACGLTMDRDHNAAINILNKGLAL